MAGRPLRPLVIMPAFNEAEGIAATLAEIRGRCPDFDITVVDDGSGDKTSVRAAGLATAVVRLERNLGIGAAVQTGYHFARQGGYGCAVQVDADGQHDPAYLEALCEPVLRGEADLVIGSRFLEPGGFRSTVLRKIGIRFLAWLISSVTGRRFTDPTSGFRAAGAKAIEVFCRFYLQDYPEPESILQAHREGLRVLEIPVRMRERRFGLSSIKWIHGPYYIARVSLAVLLTALVAPHRRGFPWKS